jgi:hypothetical protein
LAVIKTRKRPRSVVFSGLWATYNTIAYEEYENLNINNKYFIVDPMKNATEKMLKVPAKK